MNKNTLKAMLKYVDVIEGYGHFSLMESKK